MWSDDAVTNQWDVNEQSMSSQWAVNEQSMSSQYIFFSDRLNLEYRATEDPYHRHRALEILRPSTELAGVYTCGVFTFSNEERVNSTMVVYGELTKRLLMVNCFDNLGLLVQIWVGWSLGISAVPPKPTGLSQVLQNLEDLWSVS